MFASAHPAPCDRACRVKYCESQATEVTVANYRSVVAVDSLQNDSGYQNGVVYADIAGVFPSEMGHEMLHVYGLSHSWNEFGTKPADNFSNNDEYQDPFDVMSNHASTYEFFNPTFPGAGQACMGGVCAGSGPNLVAPFKDALGWIAPERRWTATLGTGRTDTVTLAAVSAPEANGYLWARIAGATPGTYWTIEYRTRDGWDRQMGVPFSGGGSLIDQAILVRYYDNTPSGAVYGKSRNFGSLTTVGTSNAYAGGLLVTLNRFNPASRIATISITH
jgi:hypothetical protein